ncbi:negative elongation factor E-like isoform X2 [Branchiostoma lanceolatum]|uniref:negative elongation factor E-like isoform X2 n=1 Tax=Branchiostoma lanceolatum TaxID=7740 RepID=UPI003452C0B4
MAFGALTEEEQNLQKKYALLRKKKKALAAKQKADAQQQTSVKRAASEDQKTESPVNAEEATERAKKLIKAGAIKVKTENKDTGFKRIRKMKELEKPTEKPVQFQPFSAAHPESEEAASGSSRGVRGLYDSFVRGGDLNDNDFERRASSSFDDRDRREPRKGNTLYVHGHGITEDLLKKSFSNFGNIINISMELDKNCGFVSFEKQESADEAINEMHGTMASGVLLKVMLARRQPVIDVGNTKSPWGGLASGHQGPKGLNHKDRRAQVVYDDMDF